MAASEQTKTKEPVKALAAAAPAIEINSELEWIRFREETLGPAAYAEPAGAKLMRKMTENPFVPIGAITTLGALSYGLWCFRQGRGRDSQMMMRTRIGAQGFTIIAILAGVVLGTSKRDPSPPPNQN